MYCLLQKYLTMLAEKRKSIFNKHLLFYFTVMD